MYERGVELGELGGKYSIGWVNNFNNVNFTESWGSKIQKSF